MATSYKPTSGMLLALVRPGEANWMDRSRCQRRGLMDHAGKPTDAGWDAVEVEVVRLKELGRG